MHGTFGVSEGVDGALSASRREVGLCVVKIVEGLWPLRIQLSQDKPIDFARHNAGCLLLPVEKVAVLAAQQVYALASLLEVSHVLRPRKIASPIVLPQQFARIIRLDLKESQG